MTSPTRCVVIERDHGRTPTEWNRFDICEAWFLYACDWHQGSDTYAIFDRLARVRFRPSPILSTRTLSPNGRLILAGLIRTARAAQRARVS